jgi:serine phosphatase RsbU (regulator of sigma subunit)
VLLALLAALAGAGIGAFRAGILFDAAWPALGTLAVFTVLLAGALAEADRQRRLLREAAARAAGELEAARRIQLGLLPDPATMLGSERRLEVQAVVEPARSVGGDFYDCFKLDADRVFFIVGDVVGKGMPAALFMALSKATLKAAAAGGPGDAGGILERAGAEIDRHNPEQLFVTVFAGVLDLRSGMLQYCNAGHEPPYLGRPDGTFERLPNALRPPVGTFEGFPYVSESRQLAPGEWLCVLTDGVTEAMDEGAGLYGSRRLEQALRTIGTAASPAQILAAVRADVTRFVGQAIPSDDLTLLVLRWSSGR